MGFFGRLASAGKRVIGGIGSTIRKVAHFTAPIVRKIGEFAAPVASAASMLSEATGHHGMAKAFTNVSRVAQAVHVVAPKVGKIIGKFDRPKGD